jgi:hypothetical protein
VDNIGSASEAENRSTGAEPLRRAWGKDSRSERIVQPPKGRKSTSVYSSTLTRRMTSTHSPNRS